MKNGMSNGGSIEIVLVEDNESDVSAVVAVLKKANICNKIHVLKKGGEVMEFILQNGNQPGQSLGGGESLVLLSLNLEGISGLDLLRKIKGDERTKKLPVVMLSSSQSDRGVMEGYKLGANACIVKPLDLSKLLEAVSEIRLGWLLVSGEKKSQ